MRNASGIISNRSGDSKGRGNLEVTKARAMQESLLVNLEKLKKSKSSFSLGEQTQLAKIICAQIVVLKTKTFDEKNKLIEVYSKNLALILGENVKGYLHYCSNEKEKSDPVELIRIYVHELVEDATNVLDITMLPDEKGFNSLDQEFKDKYGKPHTPAEN